MVMGSPGRLRYGGLCGDDLAQLQHHSRRKVVRICLHLAVDWLCVPGIQGKPDYVYDTGAGIGTLHGLSLVVRGVIVIIAACRLALTCALAYFGMLYLSYTTNLADFILNCVALLFIQDIDELFFRLLLSSDKQKVIRTLDAPTVNVPKVEALQRLSPFFELGLVVTMLATVAIFSKVLEDYSEAYINSAYGEVCYGY
mmetsp:Transcript_74896/g.216535  ORF Transcript_74896/g.216535 Transcript_74896/m.216535 type:complete len:198 (-) Transcript_74896:300-893(-)